VAKVTQPLGSSEARGKLGGHVYNTWRGIATVRTKVTPATLYSDEQVAIRAKCAQCTVAWQALTNAQRYAWAQWAQSHLDPDWTGNPKRLSGYNWFVRLNVRALNLGQAISSTVPTETISYTLTGTLLNTTSTLIRLYWTNDSPAQAARMRVEVYAAGPYSADRNPTLKNAIRKGRTSILNGVFTWTPTETGYYTVFFRVMLFNGLATGWDKLSVNFTGT
jgi:hypothetical protein